MIPKLTIHTKLILSACILMSFTYSFGQDPRLFSGPVDRGNVNKYKNYLYNPIFNRTQETNPNIAARITDAQDVRVFPSANVQAEVHISINKNNPLNLIASCNTYIGNYNQGYYFSNDGGVSWGGADQLQNSPAQLNGDPSTAFSADGRAYITTMIPSGGYACQTSINGGANWSNLITGVNQSNYDKEMIASDDVSTSSFANNFYCSWSNFAGGYSVEFNRSTDNGNSFSNPIILKNGFGQGTNVQTGPNGEVYVCWADYDGTEVPSHGLGFAKSLDGGTSFSSYQRVLNYTGIRILGPNSLFGNTRVNDFPAMAVDKSNGINRGRIYVCLPVKENGNGKAIIQVSFSDDQGSTFSNPITVSIPTGRQNWFPWITVDDCNGDICVAYLSLDTQNGFETNTYVAHSSDAGITWENQKVSDVSHITGPINNTIFAGGYAGDYIGITSFGGNAYPIWSDNRNGTWQLYCSPIKFVPEIIGSNNPLCIGSSTQYNLSFLPCNSTVTWSTNRTTSEVTLLPSGSSVTITNNNIVNGNIILTATITYSNGSTTNITKLLYAGQPGYGATYFNGISNNPVQWYDPNNPITSINNVCSEYGPYYIDASPYGTNSTTWSVPSGFPYNGSLSLNQINPTRISFYFTSGIAYLKGTVTNTCGSYSQIFGFQRMNCLPIGTDPCAKSLKEYNLFTISPNPATNQIKIGIVSKPAPPPPCSKGIPQNKIGLGYTFSVVNIYNKLGNLEKSIKTRDANSITIPINSLISGIYNVEIISGTYVEKKQIIIQK